MDKLLHPSGTSTPTGSQVNLKDYSSVFIWEPSLESGLSVLDKRHKEFFDCMLRLPQATGTDEITRVMDEVESLLSGNFKYEQALHEKTFFPDKNSHKYEHSNFIYNYKQIRLELENTSGKFTLEQALKANAGFAKWLKDHIRKFDMAFKDFYFENFALD